MPNTRPILLVEDNRDDEALTLRAFKKHRIANPVVVARDGVEALDYLFATGAFLGRDTTKQTQVVLLDLNLPRINGLEVLRRIRGDERTRLVPVVVLTSSSEVDDMTRCYASGANAYVRKPVDFIEFADAAMTLSRFWLSLNLPAPQRSYRP